MDQVIKEPSTAELELWDYVKENNKNPTITDQQKDAIKWIMIWLDTYEPKNIHMAEIDLTHHIYHEVGEINEKQWAEVQWVMDWFRRHSTPVQQ